MSQFAPLLASALHAASSDLAQSRGRRYRCLLSKGVAFLRTGGLSQPTHPFFYAGRRLAALAQHCYCYCSCSSRDDDAPRRELCVYAFADDGFLTAADALLVREGPGFITIDGTDGKNRTKGDALVAKHSRAETQALNLEQKGWPKAKGKLEAKLRHVLQTLCGDKDQEMSSLTIRAAALVLERARALLERRCARERGKKWPFGCIERLRSRGALSTDRLVA